MKGFLLILLVCASLLHAQPVPDTARAATPEPFSPVRLAIVGGGLATFYTTSWFIFKQSWWKNSTSDFKWEPRAHDIGKTSYAENLDKLGHFWGGAFAAEIFYMAYDWTNMGTLPAYIAAGSTTMLTQLIVEFKDGFSPYGYSVYDALAGSLGGFWPLAKHYIKPLQYVDYKWSYWINDNSYWDAEGHNSVFTDDYVNQTHWLSLKLGKLWEPWPDWLSLAVGLGINGERNICGCEPKYEFYFGPDWDLEGLFKPQKTWSQRVVKMLNYVKWPSPVLRIRPKPAVVWFFPIEAVRIHF
jgi:hypothetical protein